MKKIFTTYAYLLFVISLNAQLGSNFVWPGDINDSGQVNEVDFLYWGIARGAEGPARSTIDSSFIGYPYPQPWPQIFPSNGLNFFFADANGDGKVDEADVSSIEMHFGRVHTPALATDDFPLNPNFPPPPINITTNVQQFDGFKEVEFTIEIGTEAVQIDSFYGLTFRLFYDKLFAKEGVKSLSLLEDSWTGGTEAGVRIFAKDEQSKGYIAVGMTRTDQTIAKGFGPVMRGIIVVEDIIFSVKPDTFDIRMDSIRLISDRMESYDTQPVSKTFVSIVTGTKRPIANANDLKVFPNPAVYGWLNIELENPEDAFKEINLYNFIGQSVEKVTFTEGRSSHRMLVARLSKGMYTIVAESKKGLYSRKVFIH